ncbi:MAG: hypothetical protein EWV62_18005 [Microcystis aeruginosa Ma_OC_LR_19540900_S633]|nr:MAG: hypothetical protein EWV62_18005 [Microcystis aeruginosa Ma_OC_LR_19540900_S633]
MIIKEFKSREIGLLETGLLEIGVRRHEIIFIYSSHFPTSPSPHTLHPTPHTLHPTPHTPLPVPQSINYFPGIKPRRFSPVVEDCKN